MPLAYAYTRVSRDEQATEERMGLPVQEEIAQRYFEYRRMISGHPLGECEWGGVFADEGVSAFHVPLLRRKAGGMLGARLKAGDQVIFPEYRRGFRDLYDLAITGKAWEEQGIGIHYADLGMDMTEPTHRAMIQMMCTMAELESRNKSKYGKQIAARLRAQGRPNTARNGFRIVKRGKIKYEVPDPDQRAIMQEIARLKDEEGLSWEQVSVRIETALCAHEGRVFKNSAFFQRTWSKDRCRKVYRRWMEILDEEGRRKTG